MDGVPQNSGRIKRVYDSQNTVCRCVLSGALLVEAAAGVAFAADKERFQFPRSPAALYSLCGQEVFCCCGTR